MKRALPVFALLVLASCAHQQAFVASGEGIDALGQAFLATGKALDEGVRQAPGHRGAVLEVARVREVLQVDLRPGGGSLAALRRRGRGACCRGACSPVRRARHVRSAPEGRPVMPVAVITLVVQFIELAAKVVPHIVDAIQSHGELTDEQKAALTARVKATRAEVATYEPRPPPDPSPTPTSPS